MMGGFVGGRVRVRPGRQGLQNPRHPKQGLGTVGATPAASIALLKPNWHYNWWWNPIQGTGVPAYLMIYDDNTQPENWQWATDGVAVFGYNEPEASGQANMTAAEGAIHWHNFVEPTFPDKPLISPSPQFGTTWLANMRTEYNTRYGGYPRWDGGICCHSYASDAAAAIAKVEQFIAYGQSIGINKVWVTEWSVPTVAQAEIFRVYADGNPNIAGYAWYADNDSYSTTGADTRLIISGALTAFGQWYVS